MVFLHLVGMFVIYAFSMLGYDTRFYMQYAEDFVETKSAGGSYGPLFYLFYVPIYYIYVLTDSKSLLILVSQSLNMALFLIMDCVVWRETKHRGWLLASMAGAPIMHAVFLMIDQRNDLLVASIFTFALLQFKAGRPFRAALIAGIAGAIKWIPLVAVFPFLVHACRGTESNSRKILKLVALGTTSIAPLVLSTAALWLLGYKNLDGAYVEHTTRIPQGNNLQFLLYFSAPFKNAFQTQIQFTEIVLAICLAALLIYVTVLAYQSEEMRYEWAIALFLAFMVASKVTNNQFIAWGYYPMLLTKKPKHFIAYQIPLQILHLKAGIDTVFQSDLGQYWYWCSLIVLMVITFTMPMVTAYFTHACSSPPPPLKNQNEKATSNP